MTLFSTEPTEAATALDLADLPVGTAVTWWTAQTQDRPAVREHGVINKVTPASYLCQSYHGHGARIRRQPYLIRGRRLTAIRTPAEQATLNSAP